MRSRTEADIQRSSAIQESLFETRPKFSFDRPVTRTEALAYVRHYYKTIWAEEEILAMAKRLWLGNYIYAVNIQGWTKPPDWTDGPVLSQARPIPGITFKNDTRDYETATLLRKLQEGAYP